jgi:hypothetical protein
MDDDGVAGAGTADIQTVGVDLLAMKLSAIRFGRRCAHDYFEGGSDYHEQAKWWTAIKEGLT